LLSGKENLALQSICDIEKKLNINIININYDDFEKEQSKSVTFKEFV